MSSKNIIALVGDNIFTKTESGKTSYRLVNTESFIKNKINYTSKDAIVILNFGFVNENNDDFIQFLKYSNPKKIYFFIEDVFRFKTKFNAVTLDTFSLEKNTDSYEVIELNIVLEIIKNLNLPFEIYHCEYDCQLIEKKYNIQLKYFDLFVCDYIYNNNLCNLDFQLTFRYKICCYNSREDIHRFLIASLLAQLGDDIQLSLNFRFSKQRIIDNTVLPINNFSSTLKEKILFSIDSLKENLILLDQTVDDFVSMLGPYDNEGHIKIKEELHDYTLVESQKSFLSLVTETRFASPMPNFSEKTLKPIITCRPFILLAPPKTLALLKMLGLKTFDRWWDESYDDILDHNQRFEAVYNLVLSIWAKPKEELEQMLFDMAGVLVYNKQALNTFREKMFNIKN